jgi:hypothetical protein
MRDPLSQLNFNAIPIEQKTLAAASITTSYALVGSVFSSPPVMVIIVSTLDTAVQFSWDGVKDAFPILANSAIILDLKSDGAPLPAVAYGPYVKEIGNPTTGTLYIGGFTV